MKRPNLTATLIVVLAALAATPGCGDDAVACQDKPTTGETCGIPDEVCSYSRTATTILACSCTGEKWLCQMLACPSDVPASGQECADYVEGAVCTYSTASCGCTSTGSGLAWECS
jgi:hypothetical protein